MWFQFSEGRGHRFESCRVRQLASRAGSNAEHRTRAGPPASGGSRAGRTHIVLDQTAFIPRWGRLRLVDRAKALNLWAEPPMMYGALSQLAWISASCCPSCLWFRPLTRAYPMFTFFFGHILCPCLAPNRDGARLQSKQAKAGTEGLVAAPEPCRATANRRGSSARDQPPP